MYRAVVYLNDDQAVGKELLLRPGKNLLNGSKELISEFGEITSLELDLVNIAASIFACDLAFKRGEREEIARRIELTIPVVNYATFESIRDDIRFALFILSHDAWTINFTPTVGIPEETKAWSQESADNLLLFSGGLDSFSAAIDLIDKDQQKTVELVSHVTANPVVRGTQEELYSYLKTQYPNRYHRIHIHVSAHSSGEFGFPTDTKREDSQRTRSFIFLSLAAIVARRRGISKLVYIAENGQMAIHLPLTAARIGAFSTYTAHPEFLNKMQSLLSRVLRYPLIITNPYLYLTKAEVVLNVVNRHETIIERTVSCWKASRVRGDFNHCGICIPCLIRRIALEYHGMLLAEYREDLFRKDVASLPPDDEGKRNLAELGEFVKLFETIKSQAEIEGLYPDLANPFFDTEKALDMYRRFALEARTVFNRYPQIREFLR